MPGASEDPTQGSSPEYEHAVGPARSVRPILGWCPAGSRQRRRGGEASGWAEGTSAVLALRIGPVGGRPPHQPSFGIAFRRNRFASTAEPASAPQGRGIREPGTTDPQPAWRAEGRILLAPNIVEIFPLAPAGQVALAPLRASRLLKRNEIVVPLRLGVAGRLNILTSQSQSGADGRVSTGGSEFRAQGTGHGF